MEKNKRSDECQYVLKNLLTMYKYPADMFIRELQETIVCEDFAELRIAYRKEITDKSYDRIIHYQSEQIDYQRASHAMNTNRDSTKRYIYKHLSFKNKIWYYLYGHWFW